MEQMTKAQYKSYLLGIVQKALDSGQTIDQALEKLTLRQYDFLIDNGVNFDSLQLTPEQQKAVQEIKKTARRKSPDGYKKRYAPTKQALFNGLMNWATANGYTAKTKDKNNFRDLDIVTADGELFHIVLSQPRKSKE